MGSLGAILAALAANRSIMTPGINPAARIPVGPMAPAGPQSPVVVQPPGATSPDMSNAQALAYMQNAVGSPTLMGAPGPNPEALMDNNAPPVAGDSGTIQAPNVSQPGVLSRIGSALSNPRMQQWMQAVGSSLLQPRQQGQSQMGVFGGAMAAGSNQLQYMDMMQQAYAEQARKAALENRKVGAEEVKAGASATSAGADVTKAGADQTRAITGAYGQAETGRHNVATEDQATAALDVTHEKNLGDFGAKQRELDQMDTKLQQQLLKINADIANGKADEVTKQKHLAVQQGMLGVAQGRLGLEMQKRQEESKLDPVMSRAYGVAGQTVMLSLKDALQNAFMEGKPVDTNTLVAQAAKGMDDLANRIAPSLRKPGAATSSYSQTATNPNTGSKIGSNDGGKTWFDTATGQAVR